MKLQQLNLFRWRRRSRRASLPGFDPAYYLKWYPDVAEARANPLHHYLERGWKEGRDPSAGFSTSGYLAANPDVAATGENPLLHFVKTGFAEGRSGYAKDARSPVPLPNQQTASILVAKRNPLESFLEFEPEDASFGQQLQGRVDVVNHDYIFGWALSPITRDHPTEIEILGERFLIGTTITGIFRSDMSTEIYGNRKQGFHYDFKPPLLSSVDHIITVRRAVDKLIIDQKLLRGKQHEPSDYS